MKDLIERYRLEAGSALAGAVLAVVAFASGAVGAITAAPAAGVCLLLAAALLGAAAGSAVRCILDRGPLAERDARIAELELRPTAEELEGEKARAGSLDAELAAANDALASVTEELAAARRECGELATRLEHAVATARLDQFSDFQLLAMADICDAEDAAGCLARPLGDPAMEQLQALGAVSFDKLEGASGELAWTLRPEWRQAVRAQREHIDARTVSLRERRAPHAAAGE